MAALSLGVDLGFGQPMEHVLRQCLIGLRLAERAGFTEEERGRLLQRAAAERCRHTDAHEQAKWFGDDFALKAVTYKHEMRSLRGAAATLSLLGSGVPPLHRSRIGLEVAISGHRDLDRMIEHHANMARALGEQLGLPDAVLEALRLPMSSGTGAIGRESCPLTPCRWRPQVALLPRALGGGFGAGRGGRPQAGTEDEVRTLRRAGFVRDFGRLGVSNAILTRAGRSAQASGSGFICSPT